MIPEEFAHATLENYQVKYPFQRTLWEAATQYVREFEQIKRNTENSLGFVAVYGEERMNELPPEQRVIMKRKHNSFGLGKTHLQVAIAKELIQRGNTVLMVSDVALMEEVMGLKQSDYPLFHERIQSLIQVPVLIWDDIGKANPTPSRQSVYYRVINERWRTQRPILFSSNEDIETLAVRIGDGAASRLLGMAKGRIYRVEGPDCRLSMI
ncbi:DNA replication protein DnaC [Thermoflavimicrobium dichotomicum]|uniref:DNA replication protein DnaC n=2 Tax=Thermoflavimicrobium dichotomicum TaxID=46223 RepID=A0A1I3T607_9BACL|nr:DNA replication protein DnaC [Thermoflavimicrobium dichotomicum]